LIPRFDGLILSQDWKEAPWDRFVTGSATIEPARRYWFKRACEGTPSKLQ
jgi:hypothetical protein